GDGRRRMPGADLSQKLADVASFFHDCDRGRPAATSLAGTQRRCQALELPGLATGVGPLLFQSCTLLAGQHPALHSIAFDCSFLAVPGIWSAPPRSHVLRAVSALLHSAQSL